MNYSGKRVRIIEHHKVGAEFRGKRGLALHTDELGYQYVVKLDGGGEADMPAKFLRLEGAKQGTNWAQAVFWFLMGGLFFTIAKSVIDLPVGTPVRQWVQQVLS
jgi:hypothetical protein